ncbi:MAG: hypothetical protein JWM10_2608 [Myxococcaceae bacterium]|nr:hypothetical protein [Myxococcaceae bacterium]
MRAALYFVTSLLLSSSALAITQPGGVQIPVGNQLQDLFNARGETAIRVREDAAIVPERFVPGCTLTFTLITRGDARFRNVFGWYNVPPGTVPSPATARALDLHVLIPCGAMPGEQFTLNLRGNPEYLGGEIGFFLRTPEDGTSGTCTSCCASLSALGSSFFSERAYNPDNTGPASSYIHLLTYDSRVRPRAFYFAWEDLYSGGDNNFTDFIARVDEIVCTGGGASCTTATPGACGAGTLQCRAGALVCVAAVTSAAERCDGVDNNCDGVVDEGAGLCAAMQVCDRGRCVDRCLSELGCFPGLRCTDRGTCVEAACETITCGANQRCEGGRCVGACEGITCPAGTTCRAGRCVDACAGVTCDSDQACVEGVCVPRCECRGCAVGQSCGSDGRCRATACAATTCAEGTTCVDGRCVDACMGARCPTGERCETGRCVEIPVPDGGVARDATPLADVGIFDLGPADAAAETDSGSSLDAATDDGLVVINDTRDACSCRVGAAARPGSGPLALVGLLGVVGWRRRQRLGEKRSRRRLP